jgi:hypothetical protein
LSDSKFSIGLRGGVRWRFGVWGVGCGQELAIEVSLAPESILRCSACEKIFGRTDAVVTEMVHLACEVNTELLKLALHKLLNSS